MQGKLETKGEGSQRRASLPKEVPGQGLIAQAEGFEAGRLDGAARGQEALPKARERGQRSDEGRLLAVLGAVTLRRDGSATGGGNRASPPRCARVAQLLLTVRQGSVPNSS